MQGLAGRVAHSECGGVLVVSQSAATVEHIAAALQPTPARRYRTASAPSVEVALGMLATQIYAALFLDLDLVAGRLAQSFDALNDVAPLVALLALVPDEDEARGRDVIACGAQDFVLPADLNPMQLPRLLRTAVERRSREVVTQGLGQRASMTLDAIGDAVLSTDLVGRITYLNQAAERMTGWCLTEALGAPLAHVFNIVDEASRQAVPDPLARAMQENRTVELNEACLLLGRDGHEYLIEDSASPIRCPDGQLTGAVIVFRDVGGLRANARDMAHLAQHDTLTDLPNRALFGERVATAIVLARRHQRQLALLYLDLDDFKTINDTFGHGCGDKILLSVTQRLLEGVRASDTICRQGGDEFVLLLSEIDSPADAAGVSAKLLAALAEPHLIDGHSLRVTASLGISLYPKDGGDTQTLLHAADCAMYQAKRRGRSEYLFFDGGAITGRESLDMARES